MGQGDAPDVQNGDGMAVTSSLLAELAEDPWPVWARLREESPVHPAPELGVTLVTGWDDVDRVCRDAVVFSAAVHASPLSRTLGPNFLHSDEPEHSRVRRHVVPVLRARTVRDLHRELIRSTAEELVRTARAMAGPVDLMACFAEPLAEFALCRFVGIEAPPAGTLGRWFRAIGAGAANFHQDPAVRAAADAAMGEIEDVVASCGAPPAGSLLAALDGADAVTAADVVATVGMFVIGGLQEPRDLLGLTLAGLLCDPTQLHDVAADRSLVGPAVEEAARWGSPVGTVTRVTTRDVVLSDALIPAGTMVSGVIAAANRDPRHWPEPDRFDVRRDDGPHLAFATGIHACIGAPAARLVVREALDAVLDHVAGVRLCEQPRIAGWEFRGPVSLLVSWT
jgi:cytochrome P450